MKECALFMDETGIDSENKIFIFGSISIPFGSISIPTKFYML